MKKHTVIWSFMLLVTAFFAVGCKSPPPPPAPPPGYADDPRSRVIGYEGVPRPEWMNGVDNSRSEGDYIFVVGNGGSVTNRTAQQGTARSNAQSKVAQWMNAVVADTMRNYLAESGTEGSSQVLFAFEQTTITTSQATLRGFDQVSYWIDQNRVYHGLFSYPKNNLRNELQNTVSEFQRNDAAAYADFRAQEAFRLLEAQMDVQRNLPQR